MTLFSTTTCINSGPRVTVDHIIRDVDIPNLDNSPFEWASSTCVTQVEDFVSMDKQVDLYFYGIIIFLVMVFSWKKMWHIYRYD